MKELILVQQKFEKGDYISPETIKDALGHEPTWHEQLSIWGTFARIYANEGVTVISHKEGIRFLTDSEALEYNTKGADTACRKLERHLYMLKNIDSSQLNSEEKNAHERSVQLNTFRIIGIDNAQKRLGTK